MKEFSSSSTESLPIFTSKIASKVLCIESHELFIVYQATKIFIYSMNVFLLLTIKCNYFSVSVIVVSIKRLSIQLLEFFIRNILVLTTRKNSNIFIKVLNILGNNINICISNTENLFIKIIYSLISPI